MFGAKRLARHADNKPSAVWCFPGGGTYTYPAAGQPRPHGVTSISGGLINTTFSYDARGNMTGGNGLSVGYTSYDKAGCITRGTNSICFADDPEHNRFLQSATAGLTHYVGSSGAPAEAFYAWGAGTQRWTNYLVAAGGVVGMRVVNVGVSTLTRYFHKDHLGSIAVITDESGTVLERLSYDACGKRRFPNGVDDPAGVITSQSNRGFTGHEELDSVALVHMNGRVYDPLIARFTSADPMTESPFSTQGWNRYSYVGNSPLNFTDPSGYCFMGCFWQSAFRAVGSFIRQNWAAIVQFAVSATCAATPVCAPFLPIVAGLTSAIITGVTSGKLGMALKAGFITAVTAGITQYIGQQIGELGGGLMGGSEGSPVAASSSGPASWGPRMGAGLGDLAAGDTVTAGDGVWVELHAPVTPASTATQLPPIVVRAPSAWSYLDGLGTYFSRSGEALGRIPGDLAKLYGNFTTDFWAASASVLGGLPMPSGQKLGMAAAGIGAIRAAQFGGQMHHAISRTVFAALEQHPNLRGLYTARDARFVTQARDLASHRGYDTFHRNLDAEVAGWIRTNPAATMQEFENYLRGVYQRPDVLIRFPGGL